MKYEYFFIVFIIFIVFTGCSVNTPPEPVQVLTDEAKAVKIIFNNPEDNIILKRRCQVLDVVSGYNEIQLRLLAVEMGGNIIEIMNIGETKEYTYNTNNYILNTRDTYSSVMSLINCRIKSFKLYT